MGLLVLQTIQSMSECTAEHKKYYDKYWTTRPMNFVDVFPRRIAKGDTVDPSGVLKMFPKEQVEYIQEHGMAETKFCGECSGLIGCVLVHEEGGENGLVMMIAPPNGGFDFTNDYKRRDLCNGCSTKKNIRTNRGCIYDKRFEKH